VAKEHQLKEEIGKNVVQLAYIKRSRRLIENEKAEEEAECPEFQGTIEQ
jgi:hypothetical protein